MVSGSSSFDDRGEFGPGLRNGRGAGDVERAGILVEHDVGLVCFEQVGGQFLGLLDEFDRGLVHRRSTVLERARTHRAAAFGHEVGVAPHQGDAVHRDAGPLRGDHRPGRVVALAVRRGTGVHGGRAVVVHFDLCVVARRWDTAGDLDVHAHADAELLVVTRLPTLGLLGAEFGVTGRVERLVERGFVVADVVGLADRGGVRLEELRDQVDPPHLGGVHADLGGEEVHASFDRRGGLGAPGATVGDDRRGVRDDRRGAHLDVRDGVHPRRHRPGHERREDRADLEKPPQSWMAWSW